MELNKVDSSNITAIGWNNNILRVLFTHGSSYDYLNVPHKVYREMLNSDSKGRFLNQKIRNIYTTVKVEE